MSDDLHFKMHALMVQNETGCTKSEARYIAWLEGPIGYHRRLGQMELPLGLSQVDPAFQPEVKK